MDTTETHFYVTGMKCDGCIAKAREALGKLPGFVEAQFDLKAGRPRSRAPSTPRRSAKP